MKRVLYLFLACAPALLAPLQPAGAVDYSRPIVTDSRIKTFVFNENEVYKITTHYGYQSNVEFGFGEQVQTISLGDKVGWQVIPAGRRLFIRALEDNGHTNMTVVTNLRVYQFDLKSAGDRVRPEEIIYVARFYYPDDRVSAPQPVVSSADLLGASGVASPAAMPAPAPTPASANYNLSYTLAGPDAIAPSKVFDDGRRTFFRFSQQAATPTISVVDDEGREIPVNVKMENGYIMVNTVARQFSLRSGGMVVCVFNETMMPPAR
jgi:type IV secretion system protein VirB9